MILIKSQFVPDMLTSLGIENFTHPNGEWVSDSEVRLFPAYELEEGEWLLDVDLGQITVIKAGK